MTRSRMLPSLEQARAELRDGHLGVAQRSVQSFLQEVGALRQQAAAQPTSRNPLSSRRKSALQQKILQYDALSSEGMTLFYTVRRALAEQQGGLATPQTALPEPQIGPHSARERGHASALQHDAQPNHGFRLSTSTVDSRGTDLPRYSAVADDRVPAYWENRSPEIWQDEVSGHSFRSQSSLDSVVWPLPPGYHQADSVSPGVPTSNLSVQQGAGAQRAPDVLTESAGPARNGNFSTHTANGRSAAVQPTGGARTANGPAAMPEPNIRNTGQGRDPERAAPADGGGSVHHGRAQRRREP